MAVNSEQTKYIKEIADKINNSKEIIIDDRKITKKDIEKLSDYEYISATHPMGFEVKARRKYILDTILNIPVLFFKGDKYVVSDSLMGEHDIEWNAEECAGYFNGLIGYEEIK